MTASIASPLSPRIIDLHQRANKSFAEGQYELAAELFEALHQALPDEFEAVLHLAVAHARSNNAREAIPAFIAALRIRREPKWVVELAKQFLLCNLPLEARCCLALAAQWQGNAEGIAPELRQAADAKCAELFMQMSGKHPEQFSALRDLPMPQSDTPIEKAAAQRAKHGDLRRMANMLHQNDLPGAWAVGHGLLRAQPKNFEVLMNLAVVYRRLRKYDAAATALFAVLWRTPASAGALSNLGNLSCEIGRPNMAVDMLDLATLIDPANYNAWNNLSLACHTIPSRQEDSAEAARRSLALRPNQTTAMNNYANALKALGRLNESLDLYKDVQRLDPDDQNAFCNYLMALQYADGFTAAEVAAEHLAFGKQFEPKYKDQWGNYSNSKVPGRRLRVGFTSPDFRNHAVAYFVEPLWAELAQFGIDIVAYSMLLAEDQITQRLKTYCAQWRNVAALDDEALAQQVRDDAIDILVDLTGHTGRNRLLVYARKPAPIQVTWLGHPNTTGLTAIDWRLTDGRGDPEGVDQYYSEKLWRLPDVFCCYRPMIRMPELRQSERYAVRPTPALTNGHITFGCCNNLAKITAPVVSLWSRLLKQIPTAVLLIEAPGLAREKLRSAVQERFAVHGIGAERLKLVGRDLANQYLTYHDIDICLDPFPCNGGTTTCDVLWMGVPLVSMENEGFMARMGVTLVSAAGFPQWVVKDEASYIAKALELASDLPALNANRLGMRAKVEASPLMDEPRFARNVAHAFRQMWEAWCKGEQAAVPAAPVAMAPAIVSMPVANPAHVPASAQPAETWQEIQSNQAIESTSAQMTIVEALRLARAAFDKADFVQAKATYWQIHQQRPTLPEANAGLGMLARREGKHHAAIVFLTAAMRDGAQPEWLYELGLCYVAIGGFWDAYACITRACRMQAQAPIAAWQEQHGQLRSVAAQIIERDYGRSPVELCKAIPHEVLCNGVLIAPEELEGACDKLRDGDIVNNGFEALAQGMVDHFPTRRDARINLAILRMKQSRIQEARCQFWMALWLQPDNEHALIGYADFLCQIGQAIKGVPIAQTVTILDPLYHVGWAVLGRAIQESGYNIEAAETALRRALSINYTDCGIRNNLAIVLKRMGRIDEATQEFNTIRQMQLDNDFYWNNYLLALQYADGYTPEQVAAEHRAFGAHFEPKHRKQWGNYTNVPDKQRSLRVGFVSPDFRNHAVSYFVEPLWAELGKQNIDIIGYSAMLNDDLVTLRLKTYCSEWHNVAQLDDDALALKIRSDRIDILIDLSGHTGRNRLLTFVRKPAPVQVTWLGHPNTTGLSAIDWRLTDGRGDPEGVDHFYCEKLWRLPDVFCCYRPLIKDPALRNSAEYTVLPTPALKNGYITFGCCNNLAKLTPPVIALWSRLLKQVPNARLLMEAPGLHRDKLQAEFRARFAEHGIDGARIEMIGRESKNQYLTYHKIDIALDPFPCNGGTTTCDILWMGVPLVSMECDGFSGRMGATLMGVTGYGKWVVQDEDGYLKLAVSLASDIDALNAERLAMRAHVEASPLMDEPRFARNVAAALRQMWVEWCDSDAGRAAAELATKQIELEG